MSRGGFEPTAPRFSVLCSTNWAIETLINFYVSRWIRTNGPKIFSLVLYQLSYRNVTLRGVGEDADGVEGCNFRYNKIHIKLS